jgi:hypothetical protein
MLWHSVEPPSNSDTFEPSLYILQQWHHSSYAAFCRNYGDHHTNAIGSCCWNEEAITTMKVDMSDRWETFKGDVDSYLDRTNEFIETVLEEAIGIMMETGMSYKLDCALKIT